MEQTSGWKIFVNGEDLEGMISRLGFKIYNAQKPIWEALSKTYAKKVEGKVTYVHQVDILEMYGKMLNNQFYVEN